MKWGLQHVKVTLEESESGETVVIEQSSDGRVTCERGKQQKSERPANTAPTGSTETKAGASAKSPAKPTPERKREGEARKAEDKPRSKPAAKKPRTDRKAGPQSGGRRTSLEWAPVKDHDYDGFAAASAAGHFKVLITKGSQWALFYELKGTWPKQLGCFLKVEKAKARAQELHDAGWPESEFGPITAGQVARACPAPQGKGKGKGKDEDEEKPEMKTTPEAEEKPAAPEPEPKSPSKTAAEPAARKPEPPGPSKTEADQDKEMMGSFTSELDAVLDEDEDD